MKLCDLHSHILPGIDDGAPSMDYALQMLENAAASDVAVLAVTPHCNAPYNAGNYLDQELKGRFLQLQQAAKDIPVQLVLGLEPLQRLLGRGCFRANTAAEVAVLLHRIQIVTVAIYSAKLGDGKTIRNQNGDDQTGWYGIDLGFEAIGVEDPDNTFFDSIGFGPCHSQSGSDFRR